MKLDNLSDDDKKLLIKMVRYTTDDLFARLEREAYHTRAKVRSGELSVENLLFASEGEVLTRDLILQCFEEQSVGVLNLSKQLLNEVVSEFDTTLSAHVEHVRLRDEKLRVNAEEEQREGGD